MWFLAARYYLFSILFFLEKCEFQISRPPRGSLFVNSSTGILTPVVPWHALLLFECDNKAYWGWGCMKFMQFVSFTNYPKFIHCFNRNQVFCSFSLFFLLYKALLDFQALIISRFLDMMDNHVCLYCLRKCAQSVALKFCKMWAK